MFAVGLINEVSARELPFPQLFCSSTGRLICSTQAKPASTAKLSRPWAPHCSRGKLELKDLPMSYQVCMQSPAGSEAALLASAQMLRLFLLRIWLGMEAAAGLQKQPA